MKKIRPSIIVPFLVVCFGLITLCRSGRPSLVYGDSGELTVPNHSGWINSFPSLVTCRLLLGLAESGVSLFA